MARFVKIKTTTKKTNQDKQMKTISELQTWGIVFPKKSAHLTGK